MSPRALAALVALVALAWWPGQSHHNALRLWLTCGAIPLWLLWPRPSLGRPWLASPLWLAAAWALARAPWLPSPGAALHAALLPLCLLSGIAAGQLAARSPDHQRAAALAAAASGLLLAALSAWRDGATLGNPNWLADLLVMTLIWTIWGLSCKHRILFWFFLVSAAGQGAALLATGSLGALAALAVAALIAATGWGESLRRRPGLWLPPLALSAAGLACLPPLQAHVEGRLWLLGRAWAVIAAQPWAGVGAGQLQPALLEAQAAQLAQDPAAAPLWTLAAHAHNEVAHALAEGGPLGLLALAPLAWALLRGRPGPGRVTVAAGAVLALVSLPLYEPATAWMAALGAGAALGDAPAQGSPPRRVWAPRAALLAALLACSAQLLGDRLLTRGAQDLDPALLAAARPLLWRPERALAHEAAIWLERGDHARALPLALEAQRRAPDHATAVLAGRALMGLARYEEAARQFERAVWLHPQLFAGHFNLARAYEAMGDRHAARRHAQRARSLRPSDPRLRWLPQ
jgi:tetratricopeptide (TPR) repeat protein